MSSYKIFISHNSAQKPFVERLSALIGMDYVCVDKYNFETGSELTREIEKHIDNSTLFVLLLSVEAIESDWVKQEVTKARQMLIDQELQAFIPFIIDKRITHEDPRFEEKPWKWIKSYLLNNIYSERLVARVILRKLTEIRWADDPILKERANLFIGRDKEMARLQEQLYENISNEKRAVIVSGLAHVGRKRLLKEFVCKNVNVVHDGYEPIRLMLTETDDVDCLIQQLNEIVGSYSNGQLLEILKATQQRISLAVEMLNKVSESHERIFIRDEKCIVLGNGRLTGWFVDLIHHKQLMPMIHFFIASQCTPKLSVERNFPSIISLQISTLDRPSMKVLFNAYAKSRKISLSEDDAKYFLDKLNGYPLEAYKVVDHIKNGNLHEAKKQLPGVVDMFSGNLVAIIKELEKTEHAKDILVLFSKFEFISYDLLQEICPYDISEAMNLFWYYALYESFGMANEYLRLSPAMTNYISRSKMELPSEYKTMLREVTEKKLKEMDTNLTDLSEQLLAVKELLRAPQTKAKEKYLIPHYVLKVIVEEYNKQNDKNVIQLVEKLLNDRAGNNYGEIERSIRYWYCCSLCRLKDRKFLTAVSYFKDAGYSYNFLRGFYERYLGHDENAEEYYQKALEMSNKEGEKDYRSKAEHELVLVKMNQGNYTDALSLAEKNYKHDKNNSYQIEAYFRCLVKSPHADKELLRELIGRMEMSFAKNKDIMVVSMKAEYEYYVNHDFSKSVDMLRDLLMAERHHYAERTLKEICKKQESMTVYNAIMKKVR